MLREECPKPCVQNVLLDLSECGSVTSTWCKRGKNIISFECKRKGICVYVFILLKPIHHIQYYSSSQLPKGNYYKCQDGDLNDESIMFELVLLDVENLSHSSWGILSSSIKLVQECKCSKESPYV